MAESMAKIQISIAFLDTSKNQLEFTKEENPTSSSYKMLSNILKKHCTLYINGHSRQ